MTRNQGHAKSLWNGGFAGLFVSQTFALWGTTMAPVVIAFGMLASGDAQGLAVVVSLRTIALIAMLPLGGVLADRLSPRTLLTLAGTAATLTQALAACLFAFGTTPVPAIAILQILNGAANALALPAFTATVPTLVQPAMLTRANSTVAIARSSAMIGGPILASGIMTLGQPALGFAANAALFALSALAALRLSGTRRHQRRTRTGRLQDLQVGWQELATRPWVWSVVMAFAIINASTAAIQSVLGPTLAVRTDGVGEIGWGLLLAAFGAGMLIAGVVFYRARPQRPLKTGLLCAIGVSALPFGLLFGNSLPTMLLFFFVAGMSTEIFTICWMSALQANIPTDRLGRISTFDAMGSYIAIPIGTSAAGLAIHQDASAVLTVLGVCVILAATTPLLLRSVRALTNGPDDARSDQPEHPFQASAALVPTTTKKDA